MIHILNNKADLAPNPNAINRSQEVINKTWKAFPMTARASNGDTFTPFPYVRDDQTDPDPLHDDNFVGELDSAALDDWKYVDVTIHDQSGHSATWRLVDLPKIRRVLPDHPVIDADKTVDGLRMQLAATREHRDNFGYGIDAQARCTVAANSSNQYEVEWFHFTSDHAGYSDDILKPFDKPKVNTLAVTRTWDTQEDDPHSIGVGWLCPFAAHEHYVQVSGVVHREVILDEMLPFHDIDIVRMGDVEAGNHVYADYEFRVNHDQTIVTPSGVHVTVLHQNCDIRHPDYGLVHSLRLIPSLPNAIEHSKQMIIPNSPLWIAYHRPIIVGYAGKSPFQTGSGGGDPNVDYCELEIYAPNNKLPFDKPAHIDTLTLILRQRVDLQDTPFTMTAPLVDAPPKSK